jgi:hypothetical protein
MAPITTHIRKMIQTADRLAAKCNEASDALPLRFTDDEYATMRTSDAHKDVWPEEALRFAADLLDHAAAELRAEANQLRGWRQV